MKQLKTAGGEAKGTRQTDLATLMAGALDAQYAELIEAVWAAERNWALDDRVAAAIKYGR